MSGTAFTNNNHNNTIICLNENIPTHANVFPKLFLHNTRDVSHNLSIFIRDTAKIGAIQFKTNHTTFHAPHLVFIEGVKGVEKLAHIMKSRQIGGINAVERHADVNNTSLYDGIAVFAP